MVMICLNCGDEGFTNAYVYCGKCLEVAVHRYCLEKVTFKEFVYWVCDHCEVKEPDELNNEKSDAISLEDGNCTSSRHCKVSFEAKVDVPDTILRSRQVIQQIRQPRAGIDLVEHYQLMGDSPGVRMSKKIINPTSLREEKHEQRLVHSSSEQSLESHTSSECNERTQLADVSPLPAEPSKEEVTGLLAKVAREQFIQSGTQGDSSGMIEKRMSISPSGNHHENESMLVIDRRLTPESRTVVSGDPSQFFKGELAYVPKHGDQERAKPLIDFIWRGSFNIWNKEYKTFDLVAHLSVKACQKVFEEARLFPPSLQLEMLPKSNIWPKSFITSEPTDDNIALYFFPSDTRYEKEFDLLVEQMIKDEVALRATVTNAELLVFTSTELPLLYWRFQGKYYLWGVFRAKRDSSRQPIMTTGMNKSATHPTPRNEKAVGDGRDVANAQMQDVESPLSPLSNSAGLGSRTS